MIYPLLYAVSKSNKYKVWQVIVEDDKITVMHGQLDGKLQTTTTIAKPKNVGRSNATTAHDQALIEASAKHLKQFDKKYRLTKEEALEASLETFLPMLAQDYTKVGHRIQYPCYVSRKLDGLRCIADVNETQTDVTFHSRGGKTYPVPQHLKEQILTVSEKTGIMVFDGELYIHGMTLQNITSCVKKHNKNTPNLEFWVFDVPSHKTWEHRYNDLYCIHDLNMDYVKVVFNDYVESEKEARSCMDVYLEDGYEGAMLRNIHGMYEWGNRSGDLQKWKDFQDLEAQVFAVEEDKNGEGVLHCEAANTKVIFKCKMRGDHEYRSYENQLKMIDKWITVKFQQYTDSGAPQFPVGIGVRNCDAKGNPME